MFTVSDNIQKMLYTESVRKVHKKESHMHDSSNSFITTTTKECKYAFQFLKEEMEPIRMSSQIAAGIICNGESQEQKVITRSGNQECKESIIISGNVTSTRLCYNPSKSSAQTACSKSSKVKMQELNMKLSGRKATLTVYNIWIAYLKNFKVHYQYQELLRLNTSANR
jgi:hypothetical protein